MINGNQNIHSQSYAFLISIENKNSSKDYHQQTHMIYDTSFINLSQPGFIFNGLETTITLAVDRKF